MKLKIIFTFLLLLIGSVNILPQEKFLPNLSGTYLGQKPPGTTAAMFAPEIVSTGLDEHLMAFSPDGKECFWHVTFTGIETILTSRLENGKWTKPEVAPFSGKYSDGWPAYHPNGKILYFHSQRQIGDGKEYPATLNIWYVEKTDKGWSAEKPLEFPLNGKENTGCPSITRDGTIYVSKRLPDGAEKIARFRFENGKYKEIEFLPDIINISKDNFHAFIAPDESYIIYPTSAKKDIIGGGWNYYVSFRSKDDKWSELINIGKAVNSAWNGAVPSISVDGKYFFFQLYTNITWVKQLDKKYNLKEFIERENRIPGGRTADIYWIETSVIEKLRPEAFK